MGKNKKKHDDDEDDETRTNWQWNYKRNKVRCSFNLSLSLSLFQRACSRCDLCVYTVHFRVQRVQFTFSNPFIWFHYFAGSRISLCCREVWDRVENAHPHPPNTSCWRFRNNLVAEQKMRSTWHLARDTRSCSNVHTVSICDDMFAEWATSHNTRKIVVFFFVVVKKYA